MSKKSNTAVFMLVATVVNLIFVIAFAILGLFIFGQIFPDTAEDSTAMPFVLFGLCFVAPVVLSWLLYSVILKFVVKKFNLEDKLAPLFAPRRGRRPAPKKQDSGFSSPSVKG